MYFPKKFSRSKAIELGGLIAQAYRQFEAYKEGAPWRLEGYTLLKEISYRVPQIGGKNKERTIVDGDMEARDAAKTASQGDIPLGFVAKKGWSIYLIFRGTVTKREWMEDFKFKLVPYLRGDGGKVHEGFQRVYNRCRESFIPFLKGIKGPGLFHGFFITGHSLGGALSTLAVPDVAGETVFRRPIMYNFGSPRVGDGDFARAYNFSFGQTTFRIANTCDMAVAVPPPLPLPVVGGGYFTHVDTPVDFTTQAADLEENHSMETYLKALSY
jgi:triacylglycerol lipase